MALHRAHTELRFLPYVSSSSNFQLDDRSSLQMGANPDFPLLTII